MPRFATHDAASMSSIISDHSASNVPIITNSAHPITIAPANGRMRKRSKARRCRVTASASASVT